MFALIITVISIALVVALALATTYYGGTAFKHGTDSAKAAEVINEAQQLNAASQLYITDKGTSAPDLATLVSTSYLKAAPAGEWVAGTGVVMRTDLTEAACVQVNKTLGSTATTVPHCGPSLTGEYCCDNS